MALTDIENCDGWECPHAQECNDNDGQDTCPLAYTDYDDRTTPVDKLISEY